MTEKKVDDRFKKFGTVSFTSISKINDFVDYLEQDKSWDSLARNQRKRRVTCSMHGPPMPQ